MGEVRRLTQDTVLRSGWVRVSLLLLLSVVLTMVLEQWVGKATLYSPQLETKRLLLHDAVLHNQLPAGSPTWVSLGANGANVRVATVYAADFISRQTGVPVLRVYRSIDTICLVALFPLLFLFLCRRASEEYAFIGVLYTAAVMPLTYFLHAFHPWDRPSAVVWLVLLILLADRRLVAFAIVLAASMVIKYDTLLLPGLYFMMNVRRDDIRRVVLVSAGLCVISFGLYIALQLLIPGGFEHRDVAGQVVSNVAALREMHVGYPPLLMFALPLVLALGVFRRADRDMQASVVFAMGLALLLFLETNAAEVRAEIPILFLLLPGALAGLKSVLQPAAATASSA